MPFLLTVRAGCVLGSTTNAIVTVAKQMCVVGAVGALSIEFRVCLSLVVVLLVVLLLLLLLFLFFFVFLVVVVVVSCQVA